MSTDTSKDTNISAADLRKITETVGTALVRVLYEELTSMRTLWVVTPQQQQQDTLDRIRASVDHAVAHAVRRIATGQFQSVACEIYSFVIQDEAKATLVMPRGTEELHTLHDHVKSKAVLVFADPADYAAHAEAIKAQADQPALPFD